MRQRLCALVYELLLLCALALLSAGLGTFLAYSLHCPQYIRPLIQICLAILMGAYFVQQWRTKGQTLAMKTWRIRLEDSSGQRPSVQQCLLRLVLAVVGYACYGVTIVWAWLDADQQFLHDRLSSTRLTSLPKTPLNGAPAATTASMPNHQTKP
jgi:uncharacterized RDD family membrane protein YckC